MVPENEPKMVSYELPLHGDEELIASAKAIQESAPLPHTMLMQNVIWFCRLRWIIVVIFGLYGALSLFPQILTKFGLRTDTRWALIIAGLLTLENLYFLIHAKVPEEEITNQSAQKDLFIQIVIDLIVLTVVVHYVGHLMTYVAFTYLFHIVLSCIFFTRSQSFIVTTFATALFLICVVLEAAGVIYPKSILQESPIVTGYSRVTGIHLVNLLSAIFVWFGVWYLSSYLSKLLRKRDRELAITNLRLEKAQKEKTAHMLRTTHELKAPFAAIQANTQLLLKGFCGTLEPRVQDIVQRIADRSRGLSGAIHDMLQLANLRSESDETPEKTEIDLVGVIDWGIGHIQHIAEERGITIESHLKPAKTPGIEDHLKMMIQNVLSDAVIYSQKNSVVNVKCTVDLDNSPVVVIEDHGIGISEEKLHRIFDEYYRTAEAVQHNKSSTGLGLAIVAHVARSHGIKVTVQSQEGVGTKFILKFSACDTTDHKKHRKGGT